MPCILSPHFSNLLVQYVCTRGYNEKVSENRPGPQRLFLRKRVLEAACGYADFSSQFPIKLGQLLELMCL